MFDKTDGWIFAAVLWTGAVVVGIMLLPLALAAAILLLCVEGVVRVLRKKETP